MTPELQRFLDLATRPLEGAPELRDEAKSELMARAGHAGVPFEMLDLAEPLGRLEKATPLKSRPRRLALPGALVVTIAAVLCAAGMLAYDIALMSMANRHAFQRQVRFGSPEENPFLSDYVRRNAPGLPLGPGILGGGDGLTEPALWLARHPDDLAMWQEFVTRQAFQADWKGFDEATKEVIARLDADNALWPLLTLPRWVQSSCDRNFRYRRAGTVNPVTDEAGFQTALRIFSEAAGKGRYHDRSGSLVRRQIDAFPPTRSLADDLVVQGFTGFVSQPFGHYSIFPGSFAAMAEVQCARLVTANDHEGLRKFHGEWQQLLRLVRESPEPLASQDATLLHLRAMGEVFARTFGGVGMTGEKLQTQEQLDRIPHSIYVPLPPELRKVAGARLLNGSPFATLSEAEVLPSRKTELAFLDRHVAVSLALLALVFCGLVGLEACRRPKVVKGTAKGLMPLFRREDHLWIGGLGLALPWLWWGIVTRLTPLGLHGADPDQIEIASLGLLGQPLTALILGMVLLLQTVRWRWALRGGFLALGGSPFWPGWMVALLTALAIPAFGLVPFLDLRGDDRNFFLLGVSGMAACGLLWLLWVGIMNLFTPRASALRPNLAMRGLLPWTFAGVFSLVAAFGVSTFMERRWFAKDPLLPSWTSKTHLNALEEREAEGWLEP